MKITKLILSCLFLTFANLLFPQNNDLKLSGIVLDSDDKSPLYGVDLKLEDKTVETNKKGEFIIKNLKKGIYKLTSKDYNFYKDYECNININKDSSIVILLERKSKILDEVVVTGTRTERKLSKSPILTKVIRESEIRNSGSTSILESLQDNIPGILTSANPIGNNIRIKGLNSRHILFLVDGERLISESGGGNINFDQIEINEIERIEIIDGASSALYGSNAIGGVINIISKAPNQNNKIESDIEINVSDKRSLFSKASLSTKHNKISSRSYILRSFMDGYTVPKSTLAANPYLDYGGGTKIYYYPIKNLKFDISARYFRHELFNLQTDKESILKNIHYLNKNFTTTFNTNYKSEDSKYIFNLSFNYNMFLRDKIFELLSNEKERDNELEYISTRTLNTYKPSNKIEILAGLEHNYERNFSESLFGYTPTEKFLNEFSVFCQAIYKPLNRLELNFGARESYSFEYKSSFDPKFSAKYEISNLKLRAGIASAYRAPSLKELYYNFDNQGMFWIYGNPNLRPENGLYYSLSTEYTTKFINSYISGYFNKIDNKITIYDSINNLEQLGKYYKNTESASLYGFDLGFNYKPITQLIINTNYSFCHAIDNIKKEELLGNIKHSSTISLTWNGQVYKSPFTILFSGRMTSPNKYIHFMTNEVAEIKNIYHIWKLAITKPFTIKRSTINICFKINNLFNFADPSLIDPGRLYFIGIRYNIK